MINFPFFGMQRVSQSRVGSAEFLSMWSWLCGEFLNVRLAVSRAVHHGVLACVCMIFIFWHAKMQNFTPPLMEFFKYMGGLVKFRGIHSIKSETQIWRGDINKELLGFCFLIDIILIKKIFIFKLMFLFLIILYVFLI